jgi:hypothetical protein
MSNTETILEAEKAYRAEITSHPGYRGFKGGGLSDELAKLIYAGRIVAVGGHDVHISAIPAQYGSNKTGKRGHCVRFSYTVDGTPISRSALLAAADQY